MQSKSILFRNNRAINVFYIGPMHTQLAENIIFLTKRSKTWFQFISLRVLDLLPSRQFTCCYNISNFGVDGDGGWKRLTTTWNITSKAYFNPLFDYHLIINSIDYSTAYKKYLHVEIGKISLLLKFLCTLEDFISLKNVCPIFLSLL